MARDVSVSILILLMILSSGCLAAIEDAAEDIDQTIKDIDQTINALGGDYPKIELPERIRSTPDLQNYGQCTELLEDLKTAVYDEMLVNLDQNSYWHWSTGILRSDVFFDSEGDDMVSLAESDTSTSDGGSREGEYSETNNQESGVDEADFLKTDGFNIYMLNGNLLLIMDVPEFGELSLSSNISIEGNPIQMMLEGDRLVIASSIYYWNLPEDSPLKEMMSEEVTVSYPSQEEYDYTYTRVQNLVKYTVVNVNNTSSPLIEKELYIEGNYQTARLVDGTVRSITHLWTYLEGIQNYVSTPSDYWGEKNDDVRMEIWNKSVLDTISYNENIINELTLDDFAPHMYELNQNNISQLPITTEKCNEFSASEDSAGRGFVSIMTIDLFEANINIEVDHITSSSTHVYASQNTLIISEPSNDWWWFWRNSGWEDATNIHVFDISEAGTTTYLSSGRVNGTVQDQFSISEYQNSIRIASTSDSWGQWWIMDVFDDDPSNDPTGPVNHVTILQDDGDGGLNQIGYIGDIAPGERIWSARFVGERAYLVTFENIDPLWVIDLSDPTNPTILGELEVPGVSTYIHPISDNLLLTIGIGPGPDGLGLDWSITQVSLFDVTDPTTPILADSMPLSPAYVDENCEDQDIFSCGWSWSWSEATYEHKAFTFWEPESLLAVPLSTYRYVYDEIIIEGEIYTHYGYEYVSSMQLINIDSEQGSLSLHGVVNHSDFYNEEGVSSWWSGSTDIRRSIFMGDYIYAFSTAGATVHKTDDLSLIFELEIPGHDYIQYYYYEEEESVDKTSE
jgi:uncharacterized secreted protein with C-terminal beta-propeller domain